MMTIVTILAAVVASAFLLTEFRAMERSAPKKGVTIEVAWASAKTFDPIKDGPLIRLRAEWMADDRPAYETVDAFERDVERVLSGHRPSAPPRSEWALAETRQRAINAGLYAGDPPSWHDPAPF